MRKVAIYLRVSTEEQARIQDGSLVSQRQRLLEYIEIQNKREARWGELVEVYSDEGKSAKDMNRPEFQRLLKDVKLGRINLILSTELSRLSRSLKDFCEVWDLFKKHQTGFITLREQFDTTTAAGEMMVFNLINFAQYERKQTAERISANWLSRAKRGLWNGGSIPLGFDRNPKSPGELVPSPTEAKRVQEIFQIFLEVGSVRKTCLELSKRGIFSKNFTNKQGFERGGKHITVMSLQRILTNKAYIGVREINVGNGVCEVTKAVWAPLIEEALFNKVQERLTLNKNKYKPESWKRYPFPLTELLVCGECGKNLGGKSGHGNGGKHFYYGHPRQLHSDGVTHLKRCQIENVRAPKLEEIVLRSLKSLLKEPGILETALEAYAKHTSTEIPALEGKLRTIEQDLAKEERRKMNLTQRLSDLPEDLSAEPIYEQLRLIQQKIKDLKTTKNSLGYKAKEATSRSIDRDQLLFRLRRTIQVLEETPVENQRPLFASLIKFTEIHATKIKMGILAPTKSDPQGPETKKATALGGFGVPNRGGSWTVSVGAPGRT